MRSTIDVFAGSCGRGRLVSAISADFAEQRARAGDEFGFVAAFGRKS